MPLDAEPGSASAESYLTVAEADALAAQQGLGRAAEKWSAADDEDKAKALIRATSEIDAYIGHVGTRWSLVQSLLFPRAIDYAVIDNAQEPLIPTNVRMATYAQALHVLHNANLMDDADSRRARGLFQFADDDGSGSMSNIVGQGQLGAQAVMYLAPLRAGTGRATLKSVPITSSYQ